MPQLVAGLDVETIGIIGGAIGAFAGGTFGGIRLGLKKVRGEGGQAARIVGGTIMGSVEVTTLSDRLRENTEMMHRMGERICDSLNEATHQVERLRDKM